MLVVIAMIAVGAGEAPVKCVVHGIVLRCCVLPPPALDVVVALPKFAVNVFSLL